MLKKKKKIILDIEKVRNIDDFPAFLLENKLLEM